MARQATDPKNKTLCFSLIRTVIYTINLLTVVTLGGACDGGGASPIGLQVTQFVAVGGRLAAAQAAAAYAIRAEGRGRSIKCPVKAKFHYAS